MKAMIVKMIAVKLLQTKKLVMTEKIAVMRVLSQIIIQAKKSRHTLTIKLMQPNTTANNHSTRIKFIIIITSQNILISIMCLHNNTKPKPNNIRIKKGMEETKSLRF